MNFLTKRRIPALALVLILGFLPILGAQTPPRLYDVEGLLPGSLDLHLPESSLSKATGGTLTGDADAFMSTVDWSSIEGMESTFILGGVDEYGLALGFAKKLGKVYLGASYSGDLIDELYRRVTNKEIDNLWKTDVKDDANDTFTSSLYRDDGVPAGAATSNNDVNIIFGVGVFGLRLGFAEWIQSVENYSDAPYWEFQESLETVLKPNLELGFNIQAGKVTIKPALWGALEIHQFKSKTGDLNPDAGSSTNPQVSWVIRDDQINFTELSGGLSLGFDIALSDTSSISFGLEGEGALRLYKDPDDPDGILSSLESGNATTGGYPLFPLRTGSSGGYLIKGGTYTPAGSPGLPLGTKVSIPLDLQISGAPSFGFTGDISERVTLGLNIAINGGFGLLTVEDDDGVDVNSITTTVLGAAPDLALGASFHLIPDHFSLHAGIGVELFSFSYATSEAEFSGVTVPKKTTTSFGMPHVRFGGGLTVNLTEAVALDAMAFSSGLDFDSTKFNLLLTLKK
jgi:hypothetical protein